MIRAFSTHATFGVYDKVLVIATDATIRSGAYQEELIRKGVAVFEYAYKDLAQAIERNATRDELLTMIEVSIIYAQEVRATHVLYGCTHYPLVHELFLVVQEKVGWKGDFVDPANYVAEEVKKLEKDIKLIKKINKEKFVADGSQSQYFQGLHAIHAILH